jgi:hypothetical protein
MHLAIGLECPAAFIAKSSRGNRDQILQQHLPDKWLREVEGFSSVQKQLGDQMSPFT